MLATRRRKAFKPQAHYKRWLNLAGAYLPDSEVQGKQSCLPPGLVASGRFEKLEPTGLAKLGSLLRSPDPRAVPGVSKKKDHLRDWVWLKIQELVQTAGFGPWFAIWVSFEGTQKSSFPLNDKKGYHPPKRLGAFFNSQLTIHVVTTRVPASPRQWPAGQAAPPPLCLDHEALSLTANPVSFLGSTSKPT